MALNGGSVHFAGVDVDRVRVAHQQQRPLLAVALQARDQIRPIGLERELLELDAGRGQHLLQIVDGRPLAAGRRRIGRVESDQFLEMRDELGVGRGPIGLRRARLPRSEPQRPRG